MQISTLALLAVLAVPAYAIGATAASGPGTANSSTGPGTGSPATTPGTANRAEQRSTPGAGTPDRAGDSRFGENSPPSAPPPAPGVSLSQPTSVRAGPVSSELGSASFQGMDRNRDGFLSQDELRSSAIGSRFNELDTDRDGRISAEELTNNGRAANGRIAPATGTPVAR